MSERARNYIVTYFTPGQEGERDVPVRAYTAEDARTQAEIRMARSGIQHWGIKEIRPDEPSPKKEG